MASSKPRRRPATTLDRRVPAGDGPKDRARCERNFKAVASAFADDPAVILPGVGKGFGSRALKVKGKIFAMISSRQEFVVKLPGIRVAELIAASRAKYFDAGRGKVMKEWVSITGGEHLWLALAKEAREFVAAS
jgi:hypothetical protein